jgi:hypothetical protein
VIRQSRIRNDYSLDRRATWQEGRIGLGHRGHRARKWETRWLVQ